MPDKAIGNPVFLQFNDPEMNIMSAGNGPELAGVSQMAQGFVHDASGKSPVGFSGQGLVGEAIVEWRHPPVQWGNPVLNRGKQVLDFLKVAGMNFWGDGILQHGCAVGSIGAGVFAIRVITQPLIQYHGLVPLFFFKCSYGFKPDGMSPDSG